MPKLSHFDEGGQAHMVDVSEKAVTDRIAVAEGWVKMRPETLALVEAGTAKKGGVLGHRAAGRHHGGEEDRRADPRFAILCRSPR